MSSQKTAASLSAERRKRINHIKKTIIGIIIIGVSILLILCGILLARLFAAQNRIRKLEKENQKLIEENAGLSASLEESVTDIVDSSVSEAIPQPEEEQTVQAEAPQEGQTAAAVEPQEGVKHAYLTFDDGPSENTGAILDILKQYNVKATFFVIGKTDQTSIDLYKRIVAEGHSLGIHSFSHKYTQIYESMESFQNDVLSLQAHLKEITGQEVHLYRFPGGSSNTVSKVPIEDCIRFLSENGFTYYDWNATNGDATGKQIAPEEMVSSVLNELEKYQNITVLMHDGAGKQQTVATLPSIIEHLQAQGVQILPITDQTKPVQHKKVESVMGSPQP